MYQDLPRNAKVSRAHPKRLDSGSPPVAIEDKKSIGNDTMNININHPGLCWTGTEKALY